MATDLREIQLSEDQKRRIAKLAEQTGKSWKEIVDEGLASLAEIADNGEVEMIAESYIKDPTARAAYFEAWLRRQRSRNPNVDDSRESIYPDRW